MRINTNIFDKVILSRSQNKKFQTFSLNYVRN